MWNLRTVSSTSISVFPSHVSTGGQNSFHETSQIQSLVCLVSSDTSSHICYTNFACLLTWSGHTTSLHPARRLHSALVLAVLTTFPLFLSTFWGGAAQSTRIPGSTTAFPQVVCFLHTIELSFWSVLCLRFCFGCCWPSFHTQHYLNMYEKFA